MIRRIRSWFAKPAAGPPSLQTRIAESEARYATLRDALLKLLFVQTKLQAEIGGQDPALQDRIRQIGDEMTRCRAEIAELQRSRVGTIAEIAFLQAV